MTLEFKSTYIEAIRKRYYQASKSEKSAILDELCAVTGFHRKHAIRILATGHKKAPKASGRQKQYSAESVIHLKKLWHVMGRICSKKMVAAFPIWLDFYEAEGFGESVKKELMTMSSSTIDRYLKLYKRQFARTKRTGTVRAKTFLNEIPIKNIDTRNTKPGIVQADTVAHCGNSLTGQFIWTLTVTDEASGWTENRAIFGKSALSVISAFESIIRDVPFDIKQVNTDNGTEFINQRLKEYLNNDKKIEMTRSRAFRKNDNAYVEQKNFTHVREVFGYERLDKEEMVYVMNEIYKFHFNMLSNYFIPQLKATEVTRIGAKYKRKYDCPKTPFQRLLESDSLTKYQKQNLLDQYNKLNPIELRKELNNQLKRFKRLVEGKSNYRYKFAA